MTKEEFSKEIRAGIPQTLPEMPQYDTTISHAPKRKDILTADEKRLALRNALRYFPKEMHAALASEFAEELEKIRTHIYVSLPSYIRNVCSSYR